MNAIIPISRVPISVRQATKDDLPFIDGLQKKHTKMVGWMPTEQLKGKIKIGHVIVAEDEQRQRLGYCIGADVYFKREDVGIIYQLNVVPEMRRSLVGATLVRAMLHRAAWGCRLFCCWCAQDIEANYFWESLGFIPLAFRAGSRGKKRVHIFWQRRVRENDTTMNYWFPSQTTSGSIREDRLVFPIPPGTHWSDAKPIILPETTHATSEEPKRLPEPRPKRIEPAPARPATLQERSGLRFGSATPSPSAPGEKRPREKREKVKNNPTYVAAARELRDRWLERANNDPSLFPTGGKYNVGRVLTEQAQPMQISPAMPLALPDSASSPREAA
jgi:N-acetylglutamate synthase-like GNAT family acetyltransferase